MTFAEILSRYDRVAVCGGPKAGKTTACDAADRSDVIHTDDYMGEAWSTLPYLIAGEVEKRDRFVVEGVMVPRALRKGMEVDAVIWMEGSHVPLNSRQTGMAKSTYKWLSDWWDANPEMPVYNVRGDDA